MFCGKERRWQHLGLYRNQRGDVAIQPLSTSLCPSGSRGFWPGSEAFPARLARPWEVFWEVIAWAEFALLVLNGFVIHAHIHLDGRHIFMTKEFLETEWITATH